MAPSSKITIATSSVLRLVKEEASYHKELEQQQARIEKLDSSDENAEYTLKQEVILSCTLFQRRVVAYDDTNAASSARGDQSSDTIGSTEDH